MWGCTDSLYGPVTPVVICSNPSRNSVDTPAGLGDADYKDDELFSFLPFNKTYMSSVCEELFAG
jgi:hypothetical protein